MLLSTGALPSTDDILYTTTKFLQTQNKNSGDRRRNKSTTFCTIWKRASIVYNHIALTYDGALHHNFTDSQLGGEKNKNVVWKYINVTQCPSCHDSCHSISRRMQAFYAI